LGNGAGALAVDLGCGPGYHSLALSKLGYEVVAVDTSQALLNELISNDESKRIKRYVGYSQNSRYCWWSGKSCDLHGRYYFPSGFVSGNDRTFKDIHQCLSGKGHFILSFRDQTRALEGVDRILPIKSDRDTVFTCLLEYEKDKIGVTDILYQFADRKWSLQKSSYKKIRIFSEKMQAIICEVGFKIIRKDEKNGCDIGHGIE